MRQKAVIVKLLQSVTEAYYKVHQVLQSALDITKCDRLLLQSGSGIKKCDKLLSESASGITKCNSFYKVRRNTTTYLPLSIFFSSYQSCLGHSVEYCGCFENLLVRVTIY